MHFCCPANAQPELSWPFAPLQVSSRGGDDGDGAAPGGQPVAASKALNSLWGWGKGLASKVEAAAASVGRELAETVQDAQPAVQAATRCGVVLLLLFQLVKYLCVAGCWLLLHLAIISWHCIL